MDKACELCYVAKKYMLPYVVEQCTKFLWSDLCAKNVCRAYEFANLFEEPRLAERCLQVLEIKFGIFLSGVKCLVLFFRFYR